jgi:hypothetical protein
MTPTNELRFVEREERIPPAATGGYTYVKTIRVLQQKWAIYQWLHKRGCQIRSEEWRDVPCVKEDALL